MFIKPSFLVFLASFLFFACAQASVSNQQELRWSEAMTAIARRLPLLMAFKAMTRK